MKMKANWTIRSAAACLVATTAACLFVACPSTANAQFDIQIGGNQVFQFQQGGNGNQGVQFSKSSRNGITKTTLTEKGTTISVEEASDSLVVTVTKKYTQANAKELEKDHPKVAKALKEFPTESGKSFVDINITLSKTFESIDAEDLEGENAEGFGYYKKVQEFAKKRGGRRMRFGNFGGDPFGRRIDIEGDLQKMIERHEKMIEGMRLDFGAGPGFRVIPAQPKPKKKKIKGIAT